MQISGVMTCRNFARGRDGTDRGVKMRGLPGRHEQVSPGIQMAMGLRQPSNKHT